jgi:hypothetical protein
LSSCRAAAATACAIEGLHAEAGSGRLVAVDGVPCLV